MKVASSHLLVYSLILLYYRFVNIVVDVGPKATFWIMVYQIDNWVMFSCDTGCQADAGHRAEGQGNYCAHRIETRVARSRGDSVEIFKKFDESVRFYKIISFLEYVI